MRTGRRRFLTCIVHIVSMALLVAAAPNFARGGSCATGSVKSSPDCCCRTFNTQCCGARCCRNDSPAPERPNPALGFRQSGADPATPWVCRAAERPHDVRLGIRPPAARIALAMPEFTLYQQGVRLNV
mgnify:FL=1